MSTAIFYDLEHMIRYAEIHFYLVSGQGQLTQAAYDFIVECRAFQRDLLRPWERTDFAFLNSRYD